MAGIFPPNFLQFLGLGQKPRIPGPIPQGATDLEQGPQFQRPILTGGNNDPTFGLGGPGSGVLRPETQTTGLSVSGPGVGVLSPEALGDIAATQLPIPGGPANVPTEPGGLPPGLIQALAGGAAGAGAGQQPLPQLPPGDPRTGRATGQVPQQQPQSGNQAAQIPLQQVTPQGGGQQQLMAQLIRGLLGV